MAHTRGMSRRPDTALSLVELDGLVLFLGRVVALLTATVELWDLKASG